MDNAFRRTAAEREISIRSSAYNEQLRGEPFGNNIGSVSCLSRRKGI